LLLLGVEEICLVINPKHRAQWCDLINKSKIPAEISIVTQEVAEGIPQGITLCREFIGDNPFYLALGDNILLGSGMLRRIREKAESNQSKSLIIGYEVKNPQDFGVAHLDSQGNVMRVEEKPQNPSSNMAVVGLYKFLSTAFDVCSTLNKGQRNEYEIADVINHYIGIKKCAFLACDSSTDFWLDTGSIESIISASAFLRELHLSGNKMLGAFDTPAANATILANRASTP